MSTTLPDDGERMVPEYHRSGLVYAEHALRYRAALDLVRGLRVLDIASGSGYGTAILAETAHDVIGVDVSAAAVSYAEENFSSPNSRYLVGSGVSIPVDDASVDVVVSFETIEHIDDYRAFMAEIRRVLTPDGLAIISTPNDSEFAEGNHFHIHQFERLEFEELIRTEFAYTQNFFEGTWKYVALGTEQQLSNPEFGWRTLNYAPVLPERMLYFYSLCSNRPIIEELEPLAAIGEHYSEREILAAGAATQAHIDRIDQRADDLRSSIQTLSQERSRLQEELDGLRRSRAFRLAQRLGQIRGSLFRSSH